MIEKFRKYFLPLLTLVVVASTFLYYRSVAVIDYADYTQSFEKRLHHQQKKLSNFLQTKAKSFGHKEISEQWAEKEVKSNFFTHVYRNDSLLYWNTNQLPILRFADIHFPENGLIKLQNGWYWSKTVEANNYKICGTFLIQQDYAYENKDLINGFSSVFNMPFKAHISVTNEEGFNVNDSEGNYLLSLVPSENQKASTTQSYVYLILFLLTCWLLLMLLYKYQQLLDIKGIIVPIIIASIQFGLLKSEWWIGIKFFEVFDPQLFGLNIWFPNFGVFLLNVAILIYFIYSVKAVVRRLQNKWIIAFIAFLSFFVWRFLIYMTFILVEDSSIPLMIEDVFSLNLYSLVAVIAIGAVFYIQYLLSNLLVKRLLKVGFKLTTIAVGLFVLSTTYFFYEIYAGYDLLSAAVLPLFVYAIAVFLMTKSEQTSSFSIGLLTLFFFTAVISNALIQFNEQKEKAEREIYANQVATEKSIDTESRYLELAPKIEEDNFLQKLVKSPFRMRLSDLKENLERRFFNGYWERYELNFNLYDELGKSIVDINNTGSQSVKDLDKIIEVSGEHSEISNETYFINDYREQYSYIIKQPIVAENGNKATLYITLKSKKIPEEIGFPRLLISSEAQVLEPLENYSIAKYHNGRLLTNYGEFNFPISIKIMFEDKSVSTGYINYGGYNHYILEKSHHDAIVLSKKQPSFLDLLTNFSYLLVFFGLLLLPLIFRSSSDLTKRTFTLAMRIQLVLIALVFISLLAFGWGSGVFIENQYNDYTNNMIREKLRSVETEVVSSLGRFDELDISNDGEFIEYILKKFSRVFFTDINLYDQNGYLLASSRPKIFNVGLISEQMNPVAFKNLNFGQRSEYVHLEHIGKLSYSSAYQPFYNTEGRKLAYINLQHFGQQREFESQIQKFLVAIINVFILLLAVSIILAIFISNWLTAPLRTLQEKVAGLKFGEKNEPINYAAEDEIGSLVKEYNKKLEELEYTAEQLAKSERESAWREMAKQVAHEIKNPLTPMKLSVQQLLRAYNPDDPNSQMKLERVANSIVEQIDALTKIANEFSNFAKMPTLSMSELNLHKLIQGVVDVFSGKEDYSLEFTSNSNEILVIGDYDQLIRVFNNIIKNAIQALPENVDGRITIDLIKGDSDVKITVTDNGSGIPKDVQKKIFVPYFTTKSTGTGLGLAMVKQIIENHQGSIDYDTEQNVGTTFNIHIPLAR